VARSGGLIRQGLHRPWPYAPWGAAIGIPTPSGRRPCRSSVIAGAGRALIQRPGSSVHADALALPRKRAATGITPHHTAIRRAAGSWRSCRTTHSATWSQSGTRCASNAIGSLDPAQRDGQAIWDAFSYIRKPTWPDGYSGHSHDRAFDRLRERQLVFHAKLRHLTFVTAVFDLEPPPALTSARQPSKREHLASHRRPDAERRCSCSATAE
jgi:hypothetical protein